MHMGARSMMAFRADVSFCVCWQVSDVNGIVERLLLFLESGSDHIIAQVSHRARQLLLVFACTRHGRVHQQASRLSASAGSK